MPTIVEAKCPKCGAPLSVQPGIDTARCQYCGMSVMIDHGASGGRVPLGATEYQGMPVVRIGAAAPNPAIIVAAIVGVFGFVLVTIIVAVASSSKKSSASAVDPGVPASDSSDSNMRFSDKPMLVDVNGDGVIDIVGKSDNPGAEDWIAAYDGRDGKELWHTATITKDAADSQSLRAVVSDKVVSFDALGKAQAYDLRTGRPAWSALLGEKVQEVCLGDHGVLVVTTTDKAHHGLEVGSGKKHDVAKDAKCRAVASTHREISQGYQIVDWPKFAELGLPELHEIEGLYAHDALVPDGTGPAFMLGSRSTGTAVPMVAGVKRKKVAAAEKPSASPHHGKKHHHMPPPKSDKPEKAQVIWKDVVPGVDPMTTSGNSVRENAGFAHGMLVIPYDMKDSGGGTRMACFEGASGKRLWDIQVHTKSQVSAGMAVSNDDVFFASWTALYVFSLKTGKLRFMIGKEF